MSRILILLLIILTVSSCYYDKAEILYPGSANCTVPADVTFNLTVLPLLNTRCNNCHGGSSPSGGIALDTYAEVLKYKENGKLMGSINFASGYSPMPKNSGKLSPCEIGKIQAWINAGTPNN